jgi:hypothetical protein
MIMSHYPNSGQNMRIANESFKNVLGDDTNKSE